MASPNRHNSRTAPSPRLSQNPKPKGIVGAARAMLSGADFDQIEEPGNEPLQATQLVANASDQCRRPLRTLIVDDQLLVRAGICELVKALPNVSIVGEATGGREALRFIEVHSPDLVLMDLAMPEMNGLEALVLAKKQFPQVRIIILLEHANEEFMLRALRAGADGFVVKGDPVSELYTTIKSLEEVDEGSRPQLTRNTVSEHRKSSASTEEPAKRLTHRQREVLQHLAAGRSTKEIASQLDVSVNTVKTHRRKLMIKLGVHEITGVVRYAAKQGLIEN